MGGRRRSNWPRRRAGLRSFRRQGEAESASEHLREVNAEEAFDEDGRRTVFEKSRVKK